VLGSSHIWVAIAIMIRYSPSQADHAEHSC
jgi:hypothetical protein